MKTKKGLEILFAFYFYAKKTFPNFDGKYPLDDGFSFFQEYSGLGKSSLDRFNVEWRWLGLAKIEKNQLRFNEKPIKEAIKKNSQEYKEAKNTLIQEKFLTEKQLEGE